MGKIVFMLIQLTILRNISHSADYIQIIKITEADIHKS